GKFGIAEKPITQSMVIKHHSNIVREWNTYLLPATTIPQEVQRQGGYLLCPESSQPQSASSNDIGVPSNRVGAKALEASRKGVDAMEAVGESRKDGKQATKPMGQSSVSHKEQRCQNADEYKHGNTEEMGANEETQGRQEKQYYRNRKRGEPRVDLQDDWGEMVMVPTDDIMTTSCDDLEGPSKKAN
ncbi:10191_t:CDS:2, partial [Acaulospora morrowiae]